MVLKVFINSDVVINLNITSTLQRFSDEELESFKKEMLKTVRMIQEQRKADWINSR